MKKALLFSLQLSLCTIIGYFSPAKSLAQVTTDGTVNTIVTSNENVAEITGGETRGNNLFHSFQDFSVGTGNEAFFNNADSVANIFSRVTGGNTSNIDGTIRTNGDASLFLINPAGILFGANARLDIGGSFYGSSASSILFEGGEFSAADLENPPLLTVNAPIGLGFRDNPGEITNRSLADGVGLQVLAGQKLSLLGGNLNLTGGKITAPVGVINLGGLSTAGTITIEQDGNLSFPNNVAQANVFLTDNAIVDISSDGGGLIRVNANNLELTEGSLFLAEIRKGLGSENAVAGTIEIDATRIFANNASQIRADNLGIGQAGTININTDILDFDDNSAIVVSTFGQGDAGAVNIIAKDVSFGQEWGGIYSNVGLSRVATDDPVTDAVGNGGEININTDTLALADGARISVNSVAQGDGGNININATGEVSFGGVGDTPVPAFGGGMVISGASSQVQFEGEGNSGQINIEAGALNLDTGAVFVDNSGVEGDAGDITLDIQNNISLDQGALIDAQVPEGTIGNAGVINITANSYESKGGSSVLADNQGIGDGGNINLNIEETISLNENSIIQTELGEEAVGNAGGITITADSLILNSFSDIIAQTEGQGDAGEISINANDSISLNESQISSLVDSSATGNGANISLTSGELNLANESRIIANINGQSASPSDISNAGSIDLDIAGNINLDNNSQIQSQVGVNAVGNAGNITINTDGSLISTDGSQILTGSDGNGNGGNIQIIAGESIEIGDNSQIIANTGEQSIGNAGTITLEAGNTFSLSDESSVLSQIQDEAEGNAGNISITANSLIVDNNANISSQTLGQGDAGDITINATESISLDNASIIESSVDNLEIRETNSDSEILNNSAVGDAGNITITTGDLTLGNGSELDNTSFARGNAGNITVNARGRVFLSDGSRFRSEVNDLIRGEFDAVGNAGTIDIKAQEVTLNNDSTFGSSNSGLGNAGNVIINATSNVAFASNFSGIVSQVRVEGVGDGGNIEINAGDSITLSNQSFLSANTREQGKGDAGSVILKADNISFSESLVLSQIEDQAEGNAGGIDITANTIDINNFSLVSTNAQAGTSGEAGSINLKGANISINTGSLVDALTENGFQGGNIEIKGSNLEIVSGGVVVTSAAGAGNAGGINLDLTGDITINGEGIIPRPEDIFTLREQVLNDLQASTGLFASSSAASTGSGGNIEVINGGDITISNDGIISVDSQGEGNGGILTINTDSLNLDNQAAISAITASGNGGNINLAVDDTITLKNNSIISTQASGNGNGGNIKIDTNFIVAFPNQNNDIVANAQAGQGGNINITAQSVLGIAERDSNPPNDTNDIDASSEFGLNGNVSIFAPDTNTLQGAAELPSNIVKPQQTTTQACNAGRGLASQNNLTLKGRGGVRTAPDLPLDSHNISINGEFSNSTSIDPEPVETGQGKIQPARGIKVSESGKIILTAYRTNNAGGRLPEVKRNCNQI